MLRCSQNEKKERGKAVNSKYLNIFFQMATALFGKIASAIHTGYVAIKRNGNKKKTRNIKEMLWLCIKPQNH